MADFSFSEDAELLKLNAQVVSLAECLWDRQYRADVMIQLEDPEDFERWEKLVRAAEGQEGGLHRNSSPGAIASTRDTYDRFLARFPLFFGYWKKYADLEFAIAGTEAAEMVREVRSTPAIQTPLITLPGLRARRRQYRNVRRPLGELLRFQDRHQP